MSALSNISRFIRARWTEVIPGVVGLVVIAVVFLVVLPRIADYRDVWQAVRGISWPWTVAIVVAAVINVLTFGPPMMTALPGLRYSAALANGLASTASNYVSPGGPAVGIGLSAAMLRGWGYPGQAITVAVTLTALWNQFTTFGMPSIAFTLLSFEGGSNPTLQSVAVTGLFLFGIALATFLAVLSNAAQARWVGDLVASLANRALRVAGRGPVKWSGASWVRFRTDTLELLRHRWLLLTFWTLVGHLTVYLVLICTIRALGITGGEVSLAESFAAWTIARVIGALPNTPGGFGLVEVGLSGALVAFGASRSEAVAAVLVYRFLTVGPPLVLGVIAAATWRRYHPGWTPQAR